MGIVGNTLNTDRCSGCIFILLEAGVALWVELGWSTEWSRGPEYGEQGRLDGTESDETGSR